MQSEVFGQRNLCSQDLLLDEVLRYSFPEVCRVPETNIYVNIMLRAPVPDNDIKIIGFHSYLLTHSLISIEAKRETMLVTNLLSPEAASKLNAEVWGSSRELCDRHFLRWFLYFFSLLSSLAAFLWFWMADSVLESESSAAISVHATTQ